MNRKKTTATSGNFTEAIRLCSDKHVGTLPSKSHLYINSMIIPLRFQDYKHANNRSKFSTHLLENKHSIGHVDDIMTVLCTTDKGKLMDTIERYYIYKGTRNDDDDDDDNNNNQINDTNTVKPNIIFDITVREDTDSLHTPL
jgi:hypothetical protein